MTLTCYLERSQATIQEVATQLDMSTSTVSQIIAKLVAKGLIRKSGELIGKPGRPTATYRIRLPAPVAVLQFDGTQLDGALFDSDLDMVAAERRPVEQIKAADQAAALARDTLAAVSASAEMGKAPLPGVALAINAIELENRTVVSSVLPWVNDDLERTFTRVFGRPVRLVFPSLLPEARMLPHPLPRCMVRFRISDGIGAKTMFFGRQYRGASALAGELGHVVVDPEGPLCGCGRRGCLETLCSGPAVRERVVADLESGIACCLDPQLLRACSPRQAMDHIWAAWQGRDNYITAFMDKVCEQLGWALGLVMTLIDPELVTFTGYVLKDRPEWAEEIRRCSRRWTMHAANRKTEFTAGTAELEDELSVIALGFHFQTADNARHGWIRRIT